MSRPSITTLPVVGELPLALRASPRARPGAARPPARGCRSRPCRIDEVTSVSAIETRPLLVEADRVARPRARRAARRSPSGDPALPREPGQRPVHRAGVEIAEAEPLGQTPCDRAFAGPRRPVDGDDHRCVTESSSSKNPGKLTATASASSSSHAFARDEPSDRAEHRDPVVAVRAHRPALGAGGNPSHPEAIVASP